MHELTDAQPREMPDEPPPVLGSWRNVYALVLLYLLTVIVLFWCFTRYFA